jgi:hypothetical protein
MIATQRIVGKPSTSPDAKPRPQKIATQRVIGAPTPQAIAARAIRIRMAARAIKDSRIACMSLRPQMTSSNLDIGAISRVRPNSTNQPTTTSISDLQMDTWMGKEITTQAIAAQRGSPLMILDLLITGAISRDSTMLAGDRKKRIRRIAE